MTLKMEIVTGNWNVKWKLEIVKEKDVCTSTTEGAGLHDGSQGTAIELNNTDPVGKEDGKFFIITIKFVIH